MVTPERALGMPDRALSIRFELVLIFGVGDHSLRIIHDDVAVGETALQHQAVMNADVVVDAAVVSSAVFTKRTVPFRHHLGIHLLVPLTDRLIFVEVVQPNHCRCVPVVVVTLLDDRLVLGHQEGLHYVLRVHAASPHRLVPNLL